MFAEFSLAADIGIFLAAALAIALAGVALTYRADVVADRTGLGEAMVGEVLLGITTSLSGTVTSVTAALDGNTAMAISNAVGGIAAQTAFLAVADMFYRKANLEHAAADETNLAQATLLILMLSIPLIAYATPEMTLWVVHPASIVLLIIYGAGLRMTHGMRADPMLTPRHTRLTRTDSPQEETDTLPAAPILALQLAGLIAVVGVAGWVIAESGSAIAQRAGLSQTVMGALFTAVATSLPELVTTVAAVRRGALQLAVGGIIGGNVYDVLFLAASDAAWDGGSIYHAMELRHVFLLALGILMTAILLLGLIRRERSGPAGIGFESVAILALYGGAVALQLALG